MKNIKSTTDTLSALMTLIGKHMRGLRGYITPGNFQFKTIENFFKVDEKISIKKNGTFYHNSTSHKFFMF